MAIARASDMLRINKLSKTAFGIVVPQKIMKLMDLKYGDYVQITFEKVLGQVSLPKEMEVKEDEVYGLSPLYPPAPQEEVPEVQEELEKVQE